MENIILALITGLPPTIAAVAAFIIGLRNSRKSDDIHGLVNSQLTSVKSALAWSKNKILELESLVVSLQHRLDKGDPDV